MALTKIKTGSVSDSITLTTPDINGGTIDGTVIGGATPAAISGTTGTFSSTVRAVGTTLTSASSATLAFTGTTSRLESRGADVSTRGAIQLMQATSNGSNEIVALGIDSSGNVTIAPSTSMSSGGVLNLRRNDANRIIETMSFNASTQHHHVFENNSGTSVGTITVTTSATSYNTSSDYRLKTDAQPMTGASARVQALNPVNFEWIADGSRTDGFLAHEAQEVVPECATGTKDAMRDEEYEVEAAVEEVRDEDDNVTTEAAEAVMGTRSVPDMQGIDQSKLVPLLVAALQEAIARIEILEGA